MKEERGSQRVEADEEEGVEMVRDVVMRQLGRKHKQKTKKNGPCIKQKTWTHGN